MDTELKWGGGKEDAWIQTYSGKTINVFNPREEDIDIEDIAHALAMTTRFNGHLKDYYSVAEHCINVSHIVSPQFALAGLMHDASEAYLSDVPRPIKAFMPEMTIVEGTLMNLIFKKFKVKYWTDHIKVIDRRLCVTEANALDMDISTWIEGTDKYPLYPIEYVRCLPWYDAKQLFLKRFNELYDQQ